MAETTTTQSALLSNPPKRYVHAAQLMIPASKSPFGIIRFFQSTQAIANNNIPKIHSLKTKNDTAPLLPARTWANARLLLFLSK